MYTSFFGLNEKPFAITPDPRYLFMSERHGEGLAHLLYGVTDSGGFIQLTGEVGTGKTTLVRTLLGQLPAEVDVALILNPQVTVLEFLQAICQELGVELPTERSSAMALVDALNRFLLDAHARGRRTILLVDEAQNLSEEVLEQLRLLTNLETAKQKLLQIILIGQPELREILAKNNLRQLSQRVTGRYHLEPLSRDEAAHYIEHRMRVAGALSEIFDVGAKREVYRLSGGIPRIMNVICDRALLGAYSQESRRVDRSLVRSAAAEVSGRVSRPRGLRWAIGIAGVAVAALVGAAIPKIWPVSDADPPTLMSDGPAAEAVADSGETLAILALDSEPDNEPEASDTEATLEDRLMTGELPGGSEDAMSKILSLWNVQYDAKAGGGCVQAKAAGLSCLWQRGSWSVLKQLDRPAVLTLTDSRGNTYQTVLIALADEVADLAFGDVTQSFSMDEISRLWFGQYLIIWRPPNGSPVSIRPGTRSPGVLWLRRSLAELGNETTAPSADADYFDNELEAQLRDFQRQHRLQVDGLAGEQTQIIINSALAEGEAPRLSGDI